MLQQLLGQSPLTTMGGIIGLIGLIMMIFGLLFNKDDIVKAALGALGTAVTIIGFAARDQRQHEKDVGKKRP